jgi:phosphatidate cytidylyltransferase
MWEWSRLAPLNTPVAQALYLAGGATVLAVCWYYAGAEPFVSMVLWLALVWWLVALFWISRPTWLDGAGMLAVALRAVLGWLIPASAWLALVVLHSRPDHGPWWVLYVIVLIWVADTGAYFSGRYFGGRKLAPAVSPGKTWAGVYGAIAACLIYALAGSRLVQVDGAWLAGFLLVSLVTVLFSIAGDLFESLLKRKQGVKDSSRLIPGHGGVLDRVDSLLAAAPVFLFGLRWIKL